MSKKNILLFAGGVIALYVISKLLDSRVSRLRREFNVVKHVPDVETKYNVKVTG